MGFLFFSMGAFLCRKHAHRVSGMRTRYDVDASRVFSQCMLVHIILVWVVAGVEVTRACAWCEVGLHFCSVAVTDLSQMGPSLKLMDRHPEGQAQAGTIPFKCTYFLPGAFALKK